MSKLRGIKFAYIGLAAGFLVGCAMLWLQSYLADEILEALSEETEKACECEFKVDSLRISLLTLSGTARNARIEERGVPKLYFEKIKAGFNLSKITDRIIPLTRLDLINGWARGVLEDSVTFRFIDQLTAPSPDGESGAAVKVQLINLAVINSTLREDFGDDYLVGNNTSMGVMRVDQERFFFTPKIESLEYHSANGKVKTLGGVQSEFFLKDGVLDIRSLRDEVRGSTFELIGTAPTGRNESMDASFEYSLKLKSLNVPYLESGTLSGKGELTGPFLEPEGRASLKISEDVIGSYAGIKYLELSQGKARINIKRDHVAIDQVKMSGERDSLESNGEIYVDDERVKAVVPISIQKIKVDDALFLNDVQASLTVEGGYANLSTTIKGKIGNLETYGFKSDSLAFDINQQAEGPFLFGFHQNSELSGQFNASGRIDAPDKGDTRLELDFDLDSFSLFPINQSPGKSSGIKLSGKGRTSGPLVFEKLHGNADLKLFSTHFAGEAALRGKAALEKGRLNVELGNESQSLIANLSLNARAHTGALNINLKKFTPAEYFPDVECASFSLSSQYDFPFDSFSTGNGGISLNSVEFGCKPYALALREPRQLTITKGRLNLSGITLEGTKTDFDIGGSLSLKDGFAIQAGGNLELNALLPLIPSVDDLQGRLMASIEVSGPLGDPKIKGNAEVIETEIALESANISATDISGNFVIGENNLSLQALHGHVNGGSFKTSGTVDVFNPQQSDFSFSLEEVLIDPIEDTSLVFSGDLALKAGERNRPVLSGEIRISSAEFKKNLDLTTIVEAISEYLTSSATTRATLGTLPEIDIDVRVVGTRNIFIFTNLLSAELSADLLVSGTLDSPNIKGEMKTLSGWLGLKNRRLDITSGNIAFKPGIGTPKLEVISETYVRSRVGDYILVILEASGPITDPKISLTSDSGLSQKELLSLLTTGETLLTDASESDVLGENQSDLDDNLLQIDSILSLQTLLRRLAKIDSLSFEPAFNSRRGVIEPALVARKRLSERMSLEGQSFLSNDVENATLSLLYDLTRRINLAGIMRPADSSENASFDVDASLTLISDREDFISYSIEGNDERGEVAILRGARLSGASRILSDELDRIEKEIQTNYVNNAFLDSSVLASCLEEKEYCRKLRLVIREGQEYTIDKIEISAEQPSIDFEKLLQNFEEDQVATTENLEQIRVEILNNLRSEGYIGARVSASYAPLPEEGLVKLVARVRPGDPVSFTFYGNKKFSANEFLKTINLFSRKQPFGNNTINILVENIERLYREHGYLYATITWTKNRDAELNRVNYIIAISEEGPASVSDVSFEGNDSISLDRIRQLVREEAPEAFEIIFEPEFAVDEALQQGELTLREIYIDEGYPDVKVSHRIVPSDDGKEVKIQYIFNEGQDLKSDWLKVSGFPEELTVPEEPTAPYSIPKANRYIKLLVSTLEDFGYTSPEISSELDLDSNQLTLTIDPGTRVVVGKIVIEGAGRISTQTIRQHIRLKQGDPWNRIKLSETKRSLLRLGLFSRVDLSPEDGALDEPVEDLKIVVVERGLQSLEIGAGLSSQYGIHAFGEATDKSLFKDGRSLGVRFDTYVDSTSNDISRGIASLRYADPDFFGTAYTLSEDVRFHRLELSNQEFDLDRISLASYLYRAWDSGWAHSFGHTILQENLDNVSSGAIIGKFDQGTVDLSFVSGHLTFDARDNPLNPSRGFTFNFDYKLASRQLASDADFGTLGGRFSFISDLPALGLRYSLASNSRAASSWTFGDTDEIPISQRFYLGGRNTVRGFRENSLGPRGADGSVIGGDLLLQQNTELRYKLSDNTSLLLFLDIGTIYLRERTVNSGDIRFSTGVGVRYLSPIGPIGFDLGHPIDERAGEPSVRLHFTIGNNF